MACLKNWFPLLFALIVIQSSVFAFAKEEKKDLYEVPEITAVENRLFKTNRDFTVGVGFLPLDAFYKALTLGLSYTKAFDSYLSWEVINAHVAFTQDTGLKKDLLDNFSVRPAGILEFVKYYAISSIVYTPIYSKSLLFNKNVVYSELSLVGGGGIVGFNTPETAPIVGGGVMLKFYKSKKNAIKFDTRAFYHTSPGKSSNFVINTFIGYTFEFDE